MRAAATLYAEHGFLGASMAQIAAACGASKALIYHYYDSKEDILFDVADSHVQALVRGCAEVMANELSAVDKVRLVARTLLRLYRGAEANQKVLLNELNRLPDARRDEVIAHQRQLIAMVDELVVALRPELVTDAPSRRVLVMMFFGMLNWTHTWFRPDGPRTAEQVARTAADMLIAGTALDEWRADSSTVAEADAGAAGKPSRRRGRVVRER